MGLCTKAMGCPRGAHSATLGDAAFGSRWVCERRRVSQGWERGTPAVASLRFRQVTLCGARSGQLSKQAGLAWKRLCPSWIRRGSSGDCSAPLATKPPVLHGCPVLMLSQDSGFEVQHQKETHFRRFSQRVALWEGECEFPRAQRGSLELHCSH